MNSNQTSGFPPDAPSSLIIHREAGPCSLCTLTSEFIHPGQSERRRTTNTRGDGSAAVDLQPPREAPTLNTAAS